MAGPVDSLRILCAEDNVLLGEVMSALFARSGHYVEHVVDGKTAWDRLSRNGAKYDVLVTDHEMPGLTGLQLVERVQGLGFTGRIVVHSSHITADLKEAYGRLGVGCFLVKSCRPEALLQAVHGFA